MSERLAKHQAPHPALSARSIVTPGGVSRRVCLLRPSACCSLSPGVRLSAGSALSLSSSSSSSSLLLARRCRLRRSFLASSSSSASSFAKPRCRIRLEAPAANISNFTRISTTPNLGLPANETDQRQNRRHRAQLTCCCARSTIAASLRTADCKNPD